ncbi:MAG: M20/M25/M40 family metallo-hydrolase [Gammaproteobacteria bacterium]|nr:M20/M25/M40 family metallo-hydrolase [Gammaproteobacteria bacterium]
MRNRDKITLELKKFIALRSLSNNETENTKALQFLEKNLKKIGFSTKIKGKSTSNQPSIIAHLKPKNSSKKAIIYGHYDVAPVKPMHKWISGEPFLLKEKQGRFYGRGVADNKAPLIMRLHAIKEMVDEKQSRPEILWLIQGEEEISAGIRVAHEIFKKEINQFKADIFIEETGFNDLDSGKQIAFLWSPNRKKTHLKKWIKLLNSSLRNPKIENRHLNKLNGLKTCPFISNLPDDAIYIGFGPNDKLHNIHATNESLDIEKCFIHKEQFKHFLTLFSQDNLA